MRVLLTRPFAESQHLATLLQSRGHQAVLSPAMDIHFFHGSPLSLADVQAIIVTSANGVQALARRTSVRNLPIFAVGPQTAEATRREGFTDIIQADGHSSALIEAVRKAAQPQDGTLLVAAGRHRRRGMDEELVALGFTVRIEELYDAVELPELSAAAAKALAGNALDAVMLFSPRSAQLFARQVQSANLDTRCGSVIALCISKETAAELPPIRFAASRVARTPDREGMLQLLEDPTVQAKTRGRT